jgi:hypothetical protein
MIRLSVTTRTEIGAALRAAEAVLGVMESGLFGERFAIIIDFERCEAVRVDRTRNWLKGETAVSLRTLNQRLTAELGEGS